MQRKKNVLIEFDKCEQFIKLIEFYEYKGIKNVFYHDEKNKIKTRQLTGNEKHLFFQNFEKNYFLK